MIMTITSHAMGLKVREKSYITSVSRELRSRFLDIISLRWNMNSHKSKIMVKCQLHSASGFYRAQAQTENFKKSVDLVLERIVKQRKRKKGIQRKVLRRTSIHPSLVR